MSFREKVQLFYKNSQSVCSKLNRSQKFFVFGALIFMLAGFWWLTTFTEFFFATLTLSGILLVSGVISDLLYVYSKVWSTYIGKSLLLLLYLLASTIAYAIASQVVNEVVQFDSSKLSYAITFVAILLVPFFLFASTYIVFAILIIFSQLYFFFASFAETLKSDQCFKSIIPDKLESYPGWTFLARIVIYPVAFGFLWRGVDHLGPKYETFVKDTAAAFIYHLEASKYSRCHMAEGTKVIPVNDKEIIVIRNVVDKYYFHPEECSPLILPNKTVQPITNSGD